MSGLPQVRHALATVALAVVCAGCGGAHASSDLQAFLARVAPDARTGFAGERGAVAPMLVHGSRPYFFRSTTPMPELFRFCLVYRAAPKQRGSIACRVRERGDWKSTAAAAATQIQAALPAGYREVAGPADATFPYVTQWLPRSAGFAQFRLVARRGGVTLHIH